MSKFSTPGCQRSIVNLNERQLTYKGHQPFQQIDVEIDRHLLLMADRYLAAASSTSVWDESRTSAIVEVIPVDKSTSFYVDTEK
jgi:hypothetical protein